MHEEVVYSCCCQAFREGVVLTDVADLTQCVVVQRQATLIITSNFHHWRQSLLQFSW